MGKKQIFQNVKKTMIFIVLFLFIILSLNAENKNNKFTGGIYAGWAFNNEATFDWHSTPHYSYRYRINYNIGGYIQYNIRENIGLQFDMNFQNGVYEFCYSPKCNSPEKDENFNIYLFALNGIFYFEKWKNTQVYILAGGGISGGEWWTFDNFYYNLKLGTGIRIFLNKSYFQALNLGSSFRYLFDENKNGLTATASYLSLFIGFEF